VRPAAPVECLHKKCGDEYEPSTALQIKLKCGNELEDGALPQQHRCPLQPRVIHNKRREDCPAFEAGVSRSLSNDDSKHNREAEEQRHNEEQPLLPWHVAGHLTSNE
jgi:hypothetical protein